jgi:autophagy-related protein 13
MRSDAAPMNPRRPSVSFQPFKAGSLASSPSINVPHSPGTSFPGRTSGPASLTHTRNRPSLTTLPQQVLRTPQLPNETAVASSASSSPKPAPITRYSSSFSHRRSRFSSTGSKGDDDQNSSGKQSASSSAQRGSDVINESQRASSGSMEQSEDDKNLQDFIKLLESKKDLKSFSHTDSASRDASMRRTTAALSKYRGMRESNTALSDSLSSSLLLHRSSSSSSRQLSSVPPMVHGTSVSTSSSPGKPISPHTPHTPAIPSRLSDNHTVNYSQSVRRSRSRRRSPAEPTREENSSEGTAHDTGTTAINIPTSPRAWPYARRSSSARGQHRDQGLDDEPDVYGIRSASLPADERSELSTSELLHVNIEGQNAALRPSADDRSPGPGTPYYQVYPFPPLETSRPESREDSSSRPSSMVEPVPHALRSRLSRGYRRGSPSFSSERGSKHSAGSRLSMQTGEEDDLIFHLSELGSASRRSLEETRGGSSSTRGDRRSAWGQ